MKHIKRILAVIIIGISLYISFGPEPTVDRRILFVGNSFTFGGDIPTQVRNIAITSKPSIRYDTEMLAYPDATLEDHLTLADTLDRIQEGGWDVVVLQDASSSSFRPDRVERMERSATILASAATQQGSSVLYFAHWAPGNHGHDTTGAIQTIEQTYERLAQKTTGDVARAGQVWQLADEAGLENLYSDDLHHSSYKGAFAAALAITTALGDVDVRTSLWAPDYIPQHEQDILRAAAASLSVLSYGQSTIDHEDE